MPEGLEKDLTPQDLADIIEHVRAKQTARKRKEFPGNQPETVRPTRMARFICWPRTAALYGPKIVIEKQHGNIGWWSSPEDHVVWTVEAPQAGAYRLWIHYACANDSAGNTLVIRSGECASLHKIGGTGSWENYHALEIGELKLNAGVNEIILRSEGTLRNALFDLKGVKLLVPQ